MRPAAGQRASRYSALAMVGNCGGGYKRRNTPLSSRLRVLAECRSLAARSASLILVTAKINKNEAIT